MITFRMRDFVKRHDRQLAIFGGFLLLATFVVREIVRENLKELKDSLAAAENTFRIRDEFMLLHRQLKAVDERMGKSENTSTLPLTITLDPSKRISEEQVKIAQLSEAIAEEMDNIGDLVEKMQLNPDDAKDYVKLVADTDDVKDSYQKVMMRDGSMESKMLEMIKAEEKAQQLQHTLLTDVRILEEAREQEHRREKEYRVVTYVSYALFLIGSALGLLGKIYGLKGMESAD